MSFYFLANNFAFAFGMIGAIVFVMAAWLSFDAYRIRPDSAVLARAIGFALASAWQIIHSISLGNDLLSYFGFVLFLIGLACILSSFLHKSELVANAIIVIPAFAVWGRYFHSISAILLMSIAYLSWKQWKREQNPTWLPFSRGFIFLAIASLIGIATEGASVAGPLSIIRLLLELAGSSMLGYWIWQYMQLRIRESIVMGLVGATFILATVVTLAFSTILINRVTDDTAQNLLTDAHILDFAIESLKGEALAKSILASSDADIAQALKKNDIGTLDQLAEKALEVGGLGSLTITDSSGQVLVRAHALSRRGDTLAGERAFEEASHGTTFATIEKSTVEGLSVRAGAPILSGGRVVGVLIGGYPLDNAFADRMKRLTGLEMFIYTEDASVAATAFAADGMTRLVGAPITPASVQRAVFGSGKAVAGNAVVYGEPFQASYVPLINGDGKTIGALSAAKRQGDIAAIANATNRLTLVTVVLIMLALMGPIYFFSKRFSSAS